MAELVLFKCQKCGQKFEVVNGPTKLAVMEPESGKGLTPEKTAKELVEKLKSHKDTCDGVVVYDGQGFID